MLALVSGLLRPTGSCSTLEMQALAAAAAAAAAVAAAAAAAAAAPPAVAVLHHLDLVGEAAQMQWAGAEPVASPVVSSGQQSDQSPALPAHMHSCGCGLWQWGLQ